MEPALGTKFGSFITKPKFSQKVIEKQQECLIKVNKALEFVGFPYKTLLKHFLQCKSDQELNDVISYDSSPKVDKEDYPYNDKQWNNKLQ